MFAAKWFCTLFTGHVLSFRTMVRIVDILFLRGSDALLATALALMEYLQRGCHILAYFLIYID